MNETTHPNDTQSSQLHTCVADWPQLNGGVHYKHLVDYHSYHAFGTYNLSPEEWDIREMIYNFKNNSELTDPISHRQAMQKAIGMLVPVLEKTFGELLRELTLVCIPASTAEKTAARFEEFSSLITAQTGMENGYPHVNVVVDGESKHLGDTHQPQYALDADYFKGRQVLLFDDILATGNSVTRFAEQMADAGADVVAAAVLGKTVANKYDKE